MALDVPVERFIKMIGHDGSAEPYENLPGQKAGFHEQECIEVLLQFAAACTPIEIVPQMVPMPGGPIRPIWFFPEQLKANPEDWNWQRFKRHLKGTHGVITGARGYPWGGKLMGHAVAWNGRESLPMIYDPRGKGYVYPIEAAHAHGFKPRVYWKIQEM